MTTTEVIKILKSANKWRRGADMEMPDPKQLGLAIDHAINIMKETLPPKKCKHENLRPAKAKTFLGEKIDGFACMDCGEWVDKKQP